MTIELIKAVRERVFRTCALVPGGSFAAATRAADAVIAQLEPLLSTAEEMRAGLDVSMNVSLAKDYDNARKGLVEG